MLYQVPLHRVLNWNKWWHLVARVILQAFQRRYWGLVGNYLQKVKKEKNPHLVQVGQVWGRGHGRLLPQLSKVARSSSWKAPLPSILWQKQIYILQQEGDVETKDRRPFPLCLGPRESVILKANTPMTLPEKKKRSGRDRNHRHLCPTSGRLTL